MRIFSIVTLTSLLPLLSAAPGCDHDDEEPVGDGAGETSRGGGAGSGSQGGSGGGAGTLGTAGENPGAAGISNSGGQSGEPAGEAGMTSKGGGGGAAPGLCGNGALDAGEECDDGNANGFDGCTVACRVPRLALGRDHSCGLRSDGKVLCWGRGQHGQLGDGVFHMDPNGVFSPVVVLSLSDVDAIAGGQYHTCSLKNGDVQCWGNGSKGQLGDGVVYGSEGRSEPGEIALSNVKQVSSNGGDHSCALLEGGTVRCWGDNLFGQLGNGTEDDSNAPVEVSGLTGVKQITVGVATTCALLEAGTVSCWGAAGTDASAGTLLTSSTPVAIDGLADVTEISTGGSFTCALLKDRTVRCWGEGNVGQLGNGEFVDSNTPIEVSGLTDVVQIRAGRYHACAMRADGAVHCWGDGEFGQLGDGVKHDGFPTGVGAPVLAPALANVVELGLGADHTCGLTRDREVVCVGIGGYGQLGADIGSSVAPIVATSL